MRKVFSIIKPFLGGYIVFAVYSFLAGTLTVISAVIVQVGLWAIGCPNALDNDWRYLVIVLLFAVWSVIVCRMKWLIGLGRKLTK